MSLILEALKKLERERQSSDRGFLVLGSGAWSSAPGGQRRMALALMGAALLGAAGGTAFWRVRDTRPSLPASAAAPLPATSPAPTELPPAPPALVAATPGVLPPPPAVTVTPLGTPVGVPESPSPREEKDVSPEEALPAALPDSDARFQLQAISRRDGRLVAVLGDRLIHEGDSFDGVRVLRIGEAEVELEVDGRRVVIGF